MSRHKIRNEEGVEIDSKGFFRNVLSFLKNKIAPYIDFVGGNATIIIDSSKHKSLTIEDEKGNEIISIDRVNDSTTLSKSIKLSDDPSVSPQTTNESVMNKNYIDNGPNNLDFTQWNNISSIAIPNGSIYNIFDSLLDTEKIIDTDAGGDGSISVISDAGEDYIQMNWRNSIEVLKIRITLDIDQGGTDYYRFQLRRKSDDSIISVHPFSINSTDQPEGIVTTNILTYVGSELDSFVTGGFYIVLANNSGGSVTVESRNILIIREYRKNRI